jgi:hypothetical protein
MKLKNFHKVLAETSPEQRKAVSDYMDMLDKIDVIYKKFCKETERSGGVLCHSSITEWHQFLARELTLNKIV